MTLEERAEKMKQLQDELKSLEKEQAEEEKKKKAEEQKAFGKTLQKLFGCGSTTINHALNFTNGCKKLFPDMKEKEMLGKIENGKKAWTWMMQIYDAYGIKSEDEAEKLLNHICSKQQIGYYKNTIIGVKKPSGQQIGQTVSQAPPRRMRGRIDF